MHTLVIARYKTEYDECATFEILGVFSTAQQSKDAIKDYKNKKHKYNAECLLENTTFSETPIQLDTVGYNILLC
jgi:hypothetical protein